MACSNQKVVLQYGQEFEEKVDEAVLKRKAIFKDFSIQNSIAVLSTSASCCDQIYILDRAYMKAVYPKIDRGVRYRLKIKDGYLLTVPDFEFSSHYRKSKYGYLTYIGIFVKVCSESDVEVVWELM